MFGPVLQAERGGVESDKVCSDRLIRRYSINRAPCGLSLFRSGGYGEGATLKFSEAAGETMKQETLVSVLLALCVSGCSPTNVELTDEAERVRISQSNQVEQCEYIESVTTRVGNNFKSYEHNVELTHKQLRNEAAETGATHVVVQSQQARDRSRMGTEGCNNCVSLTGQAYNCR